MRDGKYATYESIQRMRAWDHWAFSTPEALLGARARGTKKLRSASHPHAMFYRKGWNDWNDGVPTSRHPICIRNKRTDFGVLYA